MKRDEQPKQSDKNNSSPESQNTAHQFSQAQYSQFTDHRFVMTGPSPMGSCETAQPIHLQPPFASAVSQAPSDDVQSKNMFAIPTSLSPVARENSDDAMFFQSLDKLFGGERNGNPTTGSASRDTTRSSPPQTPKADSQVSTKKFSKASSLKPAPVKASGPGKIKTAIGGSKYRSQAKTVSDQIAPYDHLKNMLAERGYSFATIKSTEAGYMTDPSPLQIASFGTKLVNAVHTSDVPLLSSLLGCGISPNPCNQFRDSVMDWACKKANDSVFLCFMDHNVDMRVCDGFGRTPLHHTAWADTFSPNIAQGILQRDAIQLFLKDNAGRTPLEYVPAKLTRQWIDFLENHKDEIFPINGPPLVVTKRQNLQLPDPPNAISVDLARLLTGGHVQPEQVAAMDEPTRKTWKMPK